MAEHLHRAQILLEREQFLVLRRMARRRGCSISQLTRELVRTGLEKYIGEQDEFAAALERLTGFRKRWDEKWGEAESLPTDDIRAARTEQLAEPGGQGVEP